MPGLPTTLLLFLHFDQSGANQHVLSVYEGRQCAILIQTCHPHGYWPCLLAVRASGEGEGRRRTWRGKQSMSLDKSGVETERASGMEEEEEGRWKEAGKAELGRRKIGGWMEKERKWIRWNKRKRQTEKEWEFLTEGGSGGSVSPLELTAT